MAVSPKPQNDHTEDATSQVDRLINDYTLRIRAIIHCATDHIPLAEDSLAQWIKEFHRKAEVEGRIEVLEETSKQDNGDVVARRVIFQVTGEQVEDLEIRIATPHSQILAQSLMIFGFSSFDAFLGLLLRQLYREEPNLIYKIDEKTLKVSDLLGCDNLDNVINSVIERDVSSLLRNSYDEVFSILANRHGLQTLKKFKNWPAFVEAAQRRNLITHCNGVANSQYVDACRKAAFQIDDSVKVGDTLNVDSGYLRSCLDILYEIGVKLAHTLWRKASPLQTEDSEKSLTDETFRLLEREEWELAKTIGEFAITIPKPKNDLQVRISRINYSQALKWSGDNEGAIKILDEADWSSSIRDLRLGVEVLRENYEAAASLMREIGKKGELVTKGGYLNWPVFREFRKTPQFKDAFREIFGAESEAIDKTEPNRLNRQRVAPESKVQGEDKSTPAQTGESTMPSEQPPDEDPSQNDTNKDEQTE